MNPFLRLSILFALISCNKTMVTTPLVINEDKKEKSLKPEGTAVEGDDRYKFLSKESTFSDCYIVNHFTDMDISYFTVDFVSYRLKNGSNINDSDGYELVNEIKTLRTFMVIGSYLNCQKNESLSVSELTEIYKLNPKTVFSVETENGLIKELYINDCE